VIAKRKRESTTPKILLLGFATGFIGNLTATIVWEMTTPDMRLGLAIATIIAFLVILGMFMQMAGIKLR
jgi:hypothetical protein